MDSSVGSVSGWAAEVRDRYWISQYDYPPTHQKRHSGRRKMCGVVPQSWQGGRCAPPLHPPCMAHTSASSLASPSVRLRSPQPPSIRSGRSCSPLNSPDHFMETNPARIGRRDFDYWCTISLQWTRAHPSSGGGSCNPSRPRTPDPNRRSERPSLPQDTAIVSTERICPVRPTSFSLHEKKRSLFTVVSGTGMAARRAGRPNRARNTGGRRSRRIAPAMSVTLRRWMRKDGKCSWSGNANLQIFQVLSTGSRDLWMACRIRSTMPRQQVRLLP